MEKKRFTLLDDVYYEALCTVVEALEREGLPFCLVGGGATQAWVANLRTGQGQRRLADESVLASALRQTKDLDFSTRAESGKMAAILNTIVASRGAGAHALGPRTLRLGPVSIAFTLGPEDLSGMAELYDPFLASRTTLKLRRGSVPDEVPAIGLEELLVTKLTRRGDKAKDIVDVVELLAAARESGRTIGFDTVRGMLQEDAEATHLFEEIVSRSNEDESR